MATQPLFSSPFFCCSVFFAYLCADYRLKYMKKLLFHLAGACLACCLTTTSMAIDLATYYAQANNKKAAELKTALHGIIANHTNIGYDGLLTAYHESDRRADGYLRDWYSNATDYVIGGPKENHSYSKEGDGYNREHLVPQSWFGSNGQMKSDLVQVVPTDGYVNNRRSNYPLGENNGNTWKSANGYCKLGSCTVSGFSGQCFEPNDEVKGDIARVYFYVLACYESSHPNWNGGSASQVFDGKKYPGLKDWAMKMFLRWAKLDPVDDVERARNEVVYAKQQNRNPFVDYPSLCEYVWGDSVSYAFDVSLPHGQGKVEIPDIPDIPGGDDPVGPGPVGPDHPDAQTGTINVAECDWESDQNVNYGAGYTTTANGLTIGYYKAKSSTQPINVSNYSQLRFYDKSVLFIEGATVTKVVFHASDSKVGSMVIGDATIPFIDGELTWTGSMNPFMATAVQQSRISSIDVTIVEPEPEPDPLTRYYHSVQGLNKAELKTALHDLIQPLYVPEYGGKGEGYTWAGFAQTDVMPDGKGVRDRYSDIQRQFNGLKAVDGMNIEHIWANSWWGHTMNNAYRDLFNLYPADGPANQRKSNNPIGIVNGAVAYDNGVTKVGKSSSYRADSLITAWEPADTWKGDFARTYFYMATTYQHMTAEWQTPEGLLTVDPKAWTTMRPWVYELMLSWAEADPVDSIERARNEIIYGIQGNRNPYVDMPQLADYVWGDKGDSDSVFYIDAEATRPELFVPRRDGVIDFGLQALSRGMTRTVTVRGRNLPEGLTATIKGNGFVLSEQTLTSDEVTAGKRLTVTSNATEPGVYEAELILQGAGGFTQSTMLRMTVIDGIPAYPARDVVCSVNSKGFTASWMDMHLEPGDLYFLDVYFYTTDGERRSLVDFPVEMPDTFCVIRGVAPSETYYYEVRTPQGLFSNEVQVEMPAVTPVFSASASEMYFAAVPDQPSQPQALSLTIMGISGYTVSINCPEPFEVSTDGETWTHDLTLTSAASNLQVRFAGASEDGRYEEELALSLVGVKDIVLPLTATVDATKAFFESFELGTKGSYGEASVVCNASTWLMTNAMLATDGNHNDARGVRMKIGGAVTMQEDKLGGCDSLWFYAALYNKDTNVALTVSYSLDMGETWTPVVSDLAVTSDWTRYAYQINRDGAIRLKFETQAGNQNRRINLDDIQMSNYISSDHVSILRRGDDDAPSVYALDGRYLGAKLPARRGLYIVRQGHQLKKVLTH